MLARIRAGDWRFIAAASGPPRGSQPLLRMYAWRAARPGLDRRLPDTNFAALAVRGCDHARHIGDLKSPVDRNPSSARTKK